MTSNNTLARIYRQGTMHSDIGNDKKTDLIHTGSSFGVKLAMRPQQPPPIEQYETWLADYTRDLDIRGRTPLTASKLRRIVVMRRQGSNYSECGRGCGISSVTVKKWINLLPEHLKP